MWWGFSKQYFRERCTGEFGFAKKLVAESLDACSIMMIRRFFRRVDRYMSVYQLGAMGIAAEYAVKQYKSHCVIQQTDLDEAEAKRKERDAKLRR
jgi:hypothetical protein